MNNELIEQLVERGITTGREHQMIRAENGSLSADLRAGIIRDRAFAACLWADDVAERKRRGM